MTYKKIARVTNSAEIWETKQQTYKLLTIPVSAYLVIKGIIKLSGLVNSRRKSVYIHNMHCFEKNFSFLIPLAFSGFGFFLLL